MLHGGGGRKSSKVNNLAMHIMPTNAREKVIIGLGKSWLVRLGSW